MRICKVGGARNPLIVALPSERCDLSHEVDTSWGHAKQTVDNKIFIRILLGSVMSPIVAREKGQVIRTSGKRAENIKICEPSGKKVCHRILPGDRLWC